MLIFNLGLWGKSTRNKDSLISSDSSEPYTIEYKDIVWELSGFEYSRYLSL